MLILTDKPKTLKTVNDLYVANKDSNTPLLTDFSAEWWNDYITNYELWDSQFNRLYKNFVYFNQDFDDIVSEVLADFKSAVKAHLGLNAKKYAELYKIQILSDADYSMLNNYKMEEQFRRLNSKNGTDVFGARTDTTEFNQGARQDSTTYNRGAETETEDSAIGAQSKTTTNTISGFNSDDFVDDRKADENIAAKTDVVTTDRSAREDSTSNSYGSRKDTGTDVRGEHTDTRQNEETETYENSKEGHIGEKSFAELLKEHSEFWNAQEFYTSIFNDICKSMLIV